MENPVTLTKSKIRKIWKIKASIRKQTFKFEYPISKVIFGLYVINGVRVANIALAINFVGINSRKKLRYITKDQCLKSPFLQALNNGQFND